MKSDRIINITLTEEEFKILLGSMLDAVDSYQLEIKETNAPDSIYPEDYRKERTDRYTERLQATEALRQKFIFGGASFAQANQK